jgi:hypothetical protein
MGAVAVSPFGFSFSLEKEQKAKTLHKSKERKQIKDKISSQQKLMSLRGQKFQYHHWEQRALRQQLWKQKYSKKRAPRDASSSYRD